LSNLGKWYYDYLTAISAIFRAFFNKNEIFQKLENHTETLDGDFRRLLQKYKNACWKHLTARYNNLEWIAALALRGGVA
jgi:hypothetical protein